MPAALEATTGQGADVLGGWGVQAAVTTSPQHRRGQGMLAAALQAAGQAQQVGFLDAGGRGQLAEAQLAGGQGAGLVEDHGGDALGTLQGLGVLDQDAVTRRHPGTGHEGGGGGQSQGTGAGDDQHRYGREQTGLQGVAAQQPAEQGDQGQAHHHRHEHPADPIHQLLDGRLGGLGVFHQADDAGQHRLATQGGDLDLQIALAVDGAPHHLVTGALGDRAAFAGEQGFVHLAFALQDAAVGGDALARAQLQAVAQAQAIQGDLFFLAGRIQAPGAFRAQGFQGAQGRAGAALGAGL